MDFEAQMPVIGGLDPDVPEDVKRVREALEQRAADSRKGGRGHTVALLAVSMVLFWMLERSSSDGSASWIVALVLVLLVHEVGHLLAMRIFGYTDLKMLFIPGLGAAAGGKKLHTTATQRAMVSLMGPLPGVVLALVASLFAPFDGRFLADCVVLALFINGFNLLPLMPLDGGRYMDDTLFARWPAMRQRVGYMSGLALAYIAWKLEAWVLLAFGVFVFLAAAGSRGIITGAAALRAEVLAGARAGEPFPEQIPADLVAPAIRIANANVFTRPGANVTPAACARVLSQLWTQAAKEPATVRATAVLLLAYLLSVALAFVAWLQLGIG